jgi:hypothetical protein
MQGILMTLQTSSPTVTPNPRLLVLQGSAPWTIQNSRREVKYRSSWRNQEGNAPSTIASYGMARRVSVPCITLALRRQQRLLRGVGIRWIIQPEMGAARGKSPRKQCALSDLALRHRVVPPLRLCTVQSIPPPSPLKNLRVGAWTLCRMVKMFKFSTEVLAYRGTKHNEYTSNLRK